MVYIESYFKPAALDQVVSSNEALGLLGLGHGNRKSIKHYRIHKEILFHKFQVSVPECRTMEIATDAQSQRRPETIGAQIPKTT